MTPICPTDNSTIRPRIHRNPFNIRHLIGLLSLLVLFSATAVPAAAQDTSPLWRLKTGEVFDITLTQTTRIESQVDQRVKDVDNVLTLNVNWEVMSVDDAGTATIEMTIVSVQMKMESMPNGIGKSIDIDTASDVKKKGAEADLLKQLAPLTGSVVTFEFSPRGEIDKVVIPKTTLTALRTAPGSMKLRTLLEAEGIADLFGQTIVVLPSELKIAQPWTVGNKLETGFGNFTTTHTFVWSKNHSESGHQIADFELTTALDPVPGEQNPESKLMEFSGNGKLMFDIDAGYFSYSQSTNTLTTEKSYREKTITTTVLTTVEMKIIKN